MIFRVGPYGLVRFDNSICQYSLLSFLIKFNRLFIKCLIILKNLISLTKFSNNLLLNYKINNIYINNGLILMFC